MSQTKRPNKVEEARADYLATADGARQAALRRLSAIVDRIPAQVIEDGAGLDDLGFLAMLEESVAAEATNRSAVHRALERGLKARRELFRGTELLSVERVAEILGIQPESVRKKISRNRLLALRMGDALMIPAFQIREGEILPGVAEVVGALEGLGPLTRLDWFMMPHPDLHDRPPCSLLPREKDAVVEAARRFGIQGGV